MALARLKNWVAGHRFVSLLAVAVAVLGKNVVELCRDKAYAIDEFLYAHKAWLVVQPDDGLFAAIGRGEAFVPSALMAPFAALGGDDPASMIYVRLSMLIAVAVCAGGIAWLAASGPRIERRWRAGLGLVAAALLFSDETVITRLIEIRPDGVAVSLLISALVLLRSRRLPDRAAAAAAGLLVFAASMSSVKAVVVASGLGPVFVLDLVARRRRRPQTLRSAPMFAAGFAAGLIAVFAVVAATSSLATFWEGIYGAGAFHEEHYAAIPLERFLWPYVDNTWPILLLAVIGVIAIAVDLGRAWRADRILDIDALIILFWIGAWASYLLQKAAYPYSLIPVGVFGAILAARGLGWIAAPIVAGRGRAAMMVGVIALLGFTALTLTRVVPEHRNEGQISVQRRIGLLTSPGDAAYDMSSTFVYRPRGHRFAFIDKSRRRGLRSQLDREVPRSLIEREVVLFVWDVRFAASWRKRPLGQFILENYQPISWELFFWGRQYPVAANKPLSASFRAVKSGRYFVHPPSAASRVRIAGRRLEAPIIELERGIHRVDIDPAPRDTEIYLVWLPANGVPFDPTRYRWYGAGRKNALGRWILP